MEGVTRKVVNSASTKRLEKIHPELARRILQVIEAMQKRGVVVEVVEGLRTIAEQNALYAQGRTRPGPIVTRARGGKSFHNYAIAVDLCPFMGGQPNWNAPDAIWKQIADEAKRVGLEAGYYWKSFQDKPHVQIPGFTIAECQSLYRHGGLDGVAKAVNKRLKPLTV